MNAKKAWTKTAAGHELKVDGTLVAYIVPEGERGYRAYWAGAAYIGFYRTPAEAKAQVNLAFAALNASYS